MKLTESKIIFNDPIKAALHLNEIWENIYDWWNDKEVSECKELFFNLALKRDNWKNEWFNYLNKF